MASDIFGCIRFFSIVAFFKILITYYTVNMPIKDIERYYIAGLLVAVVIFLFLIFRPFLTVLILGTALSVVFHPTYLWILKHVARGIEWIAALLTVIVFVVMVCGPLFAIAALVFDQSDALYRTVSQEG